MAPATIRSAFKVGSTGQKSWHRRHISPSLIHRPAPAPLRTYTPWITPRQFRPASLTSRCSRGFPTRLNVHVWGAKFPHADQGRPRDDHPGGNRDVQHPVFAVFATASRLASQAPAPARRPPAQHPRAHVVFRRWHPRSRAPPPAARPRLSTRPRPPSIAFAAPA
jgi:hypothetical protein